jgi:hypothetical protein
MSSTTLQFPFTTDHAKRNAREAGSHFFDADAMRFFRSRVLPTMYGRCFVTSESTGFDHAARAYTVRISMPDGNVETVGEFNGYSDRRTAQRIARECGKATAEVRHDPYEHDAGKEPNRRHYEWRVYLAGQPVSVRTTHHKAHAIKRALNA